MTFYIVMPCFNAAPYIEQSILSVITQAGDFNIRYHVQDGGSTDATHSILQKWDVFLRNHQEFCQCRNVTFSWASEDDSGMYDALNKGFAKLDVPGDGMMAWLNADDTYFPHVFSTVQKAFSTDPNAQWISGAICLLSPEGILVPRGSGHCYYPRELVAGGSCDGEYWDVVQQNGCFWKGTLWKQAGPLNEKLRYAGDYELWTRFALHAEMRYYNVIMGTFRLRQGQLSAGSQYEEEVERVTARALRQAAFVHFSVKNPLLPRVLDFVYDYNVHKLTCGETRPQRTILFRFTPWHYFRLVGGVVKRRFFSCLRIIRAKIWG